jgi:hypothetical protein
MPRGFVAGYIMDGAGYTECKTTCFSSEMWRFWIRFGSAVFHSSRPDVIHRSGPLMRRFYSKSKQALFIYLSNNDSMKLTELPELAIIFFNYFRLIFLFDEFTSICGWLVSKQKHVWNK